MLETKMAYIDGKPYRVENFPWEKIENNPPQEVLKKGVAYRYRKEWGGIMGGSLTMSHLLPYYGTFTKHEFDKLKNVRPGLYCVRTKHDTYKLVKVYPRTPAEAKEYSLNNERDLVAATLNHEVGPENFFDNRLSQSDIGVDEYIPPIRNDDDPLNMIMKLGIRLKHAPFEPYGARLKALAVDKKHGVEGANAVNNTRRGLRVNRAMSPSKFMQLADTWQFETAIILKDLPNAMHKMDIPEGKMLVIYPSGIPFDIDSDDLIDISDKISSAIADTLSQERYKRAESDDDE